MTVRIDASQRTFPYQRHEVRPRENLFLVAVYGVVLLVITVVLARSVAWLSDWGKMMAGLYVVVSLCALVVLPFRAGYGGILPGRVVVFRRATWIVPKLFPVEQIAFLCVGLALAQVGVTNIEIGGLGFLISSGMRGIMIGPGFVVLGVWGVVIFLKSQLRGIRMDPEFITYWRGIGRITLAWDELGDALSTNDVRDHVGKRIEQDEYLPGAKIVVPADRAANSRLRVLWEGEGPPRLLLETGNFSVEPSALLTAILALRDNPELRPLLGTRESKVLFKGPAWRVRRQMYRPQQWWPKGAAPDGVAVDSDGVVRAHLC